MALWIMVALCGMGQVLTGQTARLALRVLDTVDVCGRRECVLIVNISAVQPRDSLMGFNLAIRYNPEKLVFHTMLVSGTLAEGMEQRSFSVLYGEIRAYAFTLTHLISGAKPLVAFLGDYRQECPDTTTVQLQYVEFNEEFERQNTVVVDTTPVSVYARVVDSPSRTLLTQSLLREWRASRPDTMCSWAIRVAYPSALPLRSVATVVTGLPPWIRVESVVASGGTELQAWERGDSVLSVKWRPQQQGAELVVTLSADVQQRDTVILGVLSYPLDSCPCLTRWVGDSLVVIAVPSQPSTVSEGIQRIVLRSTGVFCLEPGEQLELYDFSGKLLRYAQAEGQRYCVDFQGLPVGLYVGRWQQARGILSPVAFIVE